MSLVCLAAAVLAVGPVLDPIHGSEVTAEERELLPSGRHLGSVADLWWVEIVSGQHNGAGIAMFDRLYLSSHGRSWTQLRLLVNGLDITDPARPGSGLIDIPHGAWSSLRYESLWSDRPGFHFVLDGVVPATRARAWAGGGGEVGGPMLLPDGFMDRDPATVTGANPGRRALLSAREAALSAQVAGGESSGWVFVEGVQHEQSYPTLIDTTTGALLADHAERATVLAVGALPLVDGMPTRLTLGWQESRRSNAGAEYRFPEELTLDTVARGFIGQLATRLQLDAGADLEMAVGVGLRDDDSRLHRDTPIVTDLEEEWTMMARPGPGERLRRSRMDASAIVRLGRADNRVDLSLIAGQQNISSLPRIPGARAGVTWLRGTALPSEPAGVSMTLYDPTRRAEEWLRSVRGGVEATARPWGMELRLVAALDHAACGTPGSTALSFVTPAVGAAVTRPLAGGELFALVRREPEALTAEVAAFLDPARPSGHRYAWEDDGDGVPELGEAGRLLARTGGRYHRASQDLDRPTSNQLAFGVRTPRVGPFYAVVTGITRLLTDRFVVRYNEAVAASFEQVPLHDPGGDGRGEERAPGGGQELVAYDRRPGTEGEELYVLTNSGGSSFYVGAEVQLVTAVESWWFVNLGGAGYWSVSGATFGSFPDRNDPGILDEAAADPNARINARGRPDHDRSFAVNLMTGVIPVEGLSAALALRYRDGQPFTRILVAGDLSQGPTAVMPVTRGAARHTFHMTVDARLRYELAIGDLSGAVLLDGFNLLGSGAEILEDPRTGKGFRRPLEMIPGRALFASLELGWR